MMRRALWITCSAMTVGAATFAPGVSAQAFRCNNNLIREGMTETEIREKCRAPDLARRTEVPVYARLESGATVQTGVAITDFWYFDRGPNEYVVKITIRDSMAARIELMTVRDIESLPAEETGTAARGTTP